MTSTIQEENLKSKLNSFDHLVDSAIESTWNRDSGENHLNSLVDNFNKLSNQLIDLGNYSMKQLENESADISEFLPSNIIHFEWMEEVKRFFILWRDVTFQYNKGLVLKREGKVSVPALEQLRVDSEKQMRLAANRIKVDLETHITNLTNDQNLLSKQLKSWKHQKLPWPTYKSQFEKLQDHVKILFDQNGVLQKLSTEFKTISGFIFHNVEICKSNLEDLKSQALETIETIEATVDEKPGRLAILLDERESKLENVQYLETLNNLVEDKLKELPAITSIPIDIEGGTLITREINFQRNTQTWLESEVNPLIYELWELDDRILNSYKMALINIRNRVVIFSNEKKEGNEMNGDPKEVAQLLHTFLNRTKDWKIELEELIETINERIQSDFQLSEIFNAEKGFLFLSLQSTINQYQLRQTPIIVTVKKWWKRLSQSVRKFISNVEQEEALSTSEKIVRFIQAKEPVDSEQNYSSIFLTKGYVGKSFWVGRKTELSRFSKLVDQWKLGFRGAVILSGQRFSGKSLFGEYVAHQHFNHNTIRLIPNSTIKIEGRILTTTYDLGAALDFIKKYCDRSQPLVLIDDLESWRDQDHTLSQNVRALGRTIDNIGSRLFFLVSTSNWLKAHLEKTHDIDRIFQAEINLDWMALEEVKKAILIRHGATHRTLVNNVEEKAEVTPQDFQKIINKIYRYSEGNIGESLSGWSNSVLEFSNEQVHFVPKKNYALPDFLNPNSALILSTLMMEKRSSEYLFRKLFGPAFPKKYRLIIQRLISVGLLKRNLDGWLEVNELVVNDVGKQLGRKKYLKFYKK